jgi:hypothetical protein
MTHTPGITRPPKEMIEALKDIGAATVAGTLGHMPASATRTCSGPGDAGTPAQVDRRRPALTLQFLPQRPDLLRARANTRTPKSPAAPPRALP